MKAIVVQEDLSGRPLVWQAVPDPVCGPDDVLVDVHATALNRADLMQRAGGYPVPPGASQILGLEMAGTIAGWGSRVLGWQKGNRVRALLTGGGYAEQVVLPARMLIAMPDDRDFIWGAALPEAVLTAYLNLFMEAGLQAGETVLIHGGASGVGTYGIQMPVWPDVGFWSRPAARPSWRRAANLVRNWLSTTRRRTSSNGSGATWAVRRWMSSWTWWEAPTWNGTWDCCARTADW